MSNATDNKLSQELVELFDLKKAKLRNEELINQAAAEAQKDIRLLVMMFKDGIPDVEVQMGPNEKIRWDERAQKLIYENGKLSSIVESAARETRIRIRPFLHEMVKKAKSFYV